MASLYLAVMIDDKKTRDALAFYQTLVKQKVSNGPDWVQPETFHVTVDFLGDTERDADLVVDALKDVERRITRHNEFVFASGVHRFEQGAAWVGVNQSLKLYQVRNALREAMTARGYELPKSRFDGYTPHITLGFDVPDVDLSVSGFNIPVAFDNITVWNSFKCNGSYVENSLYTARF